MINKAKSAKKYTTNDFKLFITLIFFVLLFVDALNGYLVVNKIINSGGVGSPSQLGRMLVFLYVLFIYYKYKLPIITMFLLAIFLFTTELINGIQHQNNYGVQYGFITSYKLLYLCGVTTVLAFFLRKFDTVKFLAKALLYNVIIVAALIYFSSITGIGNPTYVENAFGTKSFFSSGNGLGLYFGVTPLILLALKKEGLVVISNKVFFFIIMSIPLVGTKTAFIFFILNAFVYVWLSRYRYRILMIFCLLLFPLIPKLIDVFSVLFDVIIFRFNKSESFLLFLGSGRVEYVLDAFDLFLAQDPSIIRLLFGGGAFVSFPSSTNVASFDTLETDFFDLFFMYGILGLGVYIFLCVFILFSFR
ncbi:hypothetical protein, partial [Colwellia sp. E150_009]